jgi:hypothetical protein
MPVQFMLDELNSAGNALNIVVLDACRDNPFGWSRSGSRGLQVVSNQPTDSIIVYATSAGATAADGTGRNGLFTSHLLNNLKKPGLSIREVFDQTGADVQQASGRAQVPAIYSQFFGVAYLGERPASPVAPQSAPVQPAVSPAAAVTPASVRPTGPPPVPATSAPRITTDKYVFLEDSTLAYAIQWLAVQTACIGIYSKDDLGEYPGFYKPSDIRQYLTWQNGNRTSITTFAGVSSDYALAAYNEITRNQSRYMNLGVKAWYIATVFSNPREIILYDPVPWGQHTGIINGIPMKEQSRRNVQTHENVEYHAWLWIYTNDGTIYWIDPTWTDEGYVWWGVVRNGREEQMAPDARLCAVKYPGQ